MKRSRLCVVILLCLLRDASAARWVGFPNTFGTVEQPDGYLEAVNHLARERYGFDNLTPGTILNGIPLGSMSLITSPFVASVAVVGSDPVAGAMTSSGTKALHITQADAQPTLLTFQLDQPVIGIAFVLMGLESAAWLEVFGDPDGTVSLGRYFIGAVSQPGMRRWVGVMEDDRNILKMRLEPTLKEDYAIDDIEIGVHAPEPTSLLIWALLTQLCWGRFRRRMSP